jgi:IgA peptidase M64/CARDB protein
MKISRLLTLAVFAALISMPLSAQSVWNTTLVWGDGDTDNRIDIVILGDGYTQAEIPIFHTHVSTFVNAWLNETPLNRYENFINIWRIDVESPQSGADKPAPCFSTPVLVNTELDAKYCTGGTQRCLTANNSMVFATAALNVPEYDELIVAVNDSVYGGCANSVSCYAAGNSSSLQVAIHELGHSVFGLADEYDYGASTNTYTGSELSQVNVSIHDATSMASLQTKWHYWLGIENVSTFEGARYYEFGIFRPKSNCKMRSNGQPFCAICREETIETILGFHGDYNAISPDPSGGPHAAGTVFSATLPKAGTGAQWQAQWTVDGVNVAGGSVSTDADSVTFSISGSVALGGLGGQHTLGLTITDTTSWYLKQTPFKPFPDVSWTVSDVIADFSVSNLTVATAPTTAGGLAQVNHDISNLGQTPSPSVRVGYYLSSNNVVDASDQLMGVVDVAALAPGASTTISKSIRVPSNAVGGNKQILVKVDDLETFLEGNELNNTGLFPGGPFTITSSQNLSTSTPFLSGPTPATLNFSLDAGPQHAGKTYYMVPSATSSLGGPGSWLGGLVGFVDLTFDQLTFDYTAGLIGAPIFNDFAGVLDANGQASASFFKPALPPGLAANLHFAYAVIDEIFFGIYTVPLVSETRSVLIF